MSLKAKIRNSCAENTCIVGNIPKTFQKGSAKKSITVNRIMIDFIGMLCYHASNL